MSKVTIIGAGSASFGTSALKGLLYSDKLDGARICLHDIDESAVSRMEALGKVIIGDGGLNKTVESTTDLGRSLDGADCVILSIATDREECWRRDREILLKHQIDSYAENGGPAAMFHAARNIALILPILKEMERICPDALLVSYTNPVPRVCTAIRKFSKLKLVGVCHQVEFGYYLAGVLLSKVIGLELPSAYHFRWTTESCARAVVIQEAAKKLIKMESCGVNHFTWTHRIESLATGADLYPALIEQNREFDPTFEPLTRKVFDLFGMLPNVGDTHLAEFLPYTHSRARDTWKRFDIQMYDLDWAEERRIEKVHDVDCMVKSGNLSPLSEVHSERAEFIAESFLSGSPYLDEGLNMPNAGGIPNLPDGAIVETPLRILPGGPQQVVQPALPEAVAELCRRQIAINELSVAGTVEGDRDKLRQALALDPMVDDPDLPDVLLDEFLSTFEDYYSAFPLGKGL